MKKEKVLFYKLMSNYFSYQRRTDDYSENLETLEKIAVANKSIPLFCEASKFVNIEPNAEFRNLTLQIVSHNYRNLNVQNKIIKHLAENGISCVVLKGASVAVNYPEPMLRTFGDIDLLVSQKDYEKSIDLLLGKKERDKIREMHKFHYQLVIDNILVEIHNAVTHFPDSELSVKEYMNNAMDTFKTKSIECFEIPVLAENFQAPALLLHTKTHYFENKLTFRMLCDWAMFVNSISDEIWNESIYMVLKNLKLDKWADSINLVCKQYLNLGLENKIHTNFEDKTIEQLANEFVSDGLNDKEMRQSGNSLKNIIIWINDIAERDFSLNGKKIYLAPLFWPVILVRYLYRRKIGLRGKTNILEYANKYSVKEKIYKKIQESE